MNFTLQWIDAIWLLLALLVVPAKKRLLSLGFIGGGMLMMRLQVELIATTGYPFGYIGFMASHILYRGLVVYSLVYFLYLILAHYAKDTQNTVFMATSISVFFIALFISTIVMVL